MAQKSDVLCCFVPICHNNQDTTPDKVFVRIHKQLKEEWCNRVNAIYSKSTSMFICEDHLDLKEDLANYYKWKLMKVDPIMKSDAKLRYRNRTEKMRENEKDNLHEMIRKAPTLAMLLIKGDKPLKRNLEESTITQETQKRREKKKKKRNAPVFGRAVMVTNITTKPQTNLEHNVQMTNTEEYIVPEPLEDIIKGAVHKSEVKKLK